MSPRPWTRFAAVLVCVMLPLLASSCSVGRLAKGAGEAAFDAVEAKLTAKLDEVKVSLLAQIPELQRQTIALVSDFAAKSIEALGEKLEAKLDDKLDDMNAKLAKASVQPVTDQTTVVDVIKAIQAGKTKEQDPESPFENRGELIATIISAYLLANYGKRGIEAGAAGLFGKLKAAAKSDASKT